MDKEEWLRDNISANGNDDNRHKGIVKLLSQLLIPQVEHAIRQANRRANDNQPTQPNDEGWRIVQYSGVKRVSHNQAHANLSRSNVIFAY